MIVRESVPPDVLRLAPRVRKADKDEVRAATGKGVQVALSVGLQKSAHCYTVVDDDGLPVAMFGVVPDIDMYVETGLRCGNVWFLGASETFHSPKEFMRASLAWLEHFRKHYDILANYVDARNEKHIAWLRAMGFEFGNTIPAYGFERRPFLEFYMLPAEEDAVV